MPCGCCDVSPCYALPGESRGLGRVPSLACSRLDVGALGFFQPKLPQRRLVKCRMSPVVSHWPVWLCRCFSQSPQCPRPATLEAAIQHVLACLFEPNLRNMRATGFPQGLSQPLIRGTACSSAERDAECSSSFQAGPEARSAARAGLKEQAPMSPGC